MGGRASAGGLTCNYSIVYDPTNFVQNQMQALKGVLKYKQMVEEYVLALQQYVTQIRQLSPAKRLGQLSPITTTINDIQDFNRIAQGLGKLRDSIETVQGSFLGRVQDMKRIGLSWDGYLRYEAERIARNAEGAIQNSMEEKRVVERAKLEFEYVKTLADRVPMSDGMHAASQNLNFHMNRMILQQGELASILAPVARANTIVTERMADQNAKDALLKERRQHVMDMKAARRESERKALGTAVDYP